MCEYNATEELRELDLV